MRENLCSSYYNAIKGGNTATANTDDDDNDDGDVNKFSITITW